METLLALTYKDGVLIAADAAAARSIVVMKHGEDKTRDLTKYCTVAFAGEPGDSVQFIEFIQRNIKLNEIRTGLTMTPWSIANYTRRELADSLRSRSPYNVNMLIAGLDTHKNEPQVFWMDYISSMVKVDFAAHGYAGYLCLSVFDRHWKPDMTLEEAKEVLKKCFHELKTRLVINQSGYTIKQIDKRGITLLNDKTLEPLSAESDVMQE